MCKMRNRHSDSVHLGLALGLQFFEVAERNATAAPIEAGSAPRERKTPGLRLATYYLLLTPCNLLVTSVQDVRDEIKGRPGEFITEEQ